MKKVILYFTLVIFALLFGSCKEQIPEDLEGKKKYVTKKKQELLELQKSLDQVIADINKLDPPKKKTALPVDAIQLEKRAFKRYIDVQAQVVADEVVNASSQIGGRIVRMTVKEGDYVKKGQVIATTDMSTMETQIAEINTSLSSQKTVYERQQKLWNQNIGSELQYLEAKTNKERLERSLETLKSQISKKYVYAPISGFIDKEFITQGETTGPGTPIVQIMNTSKIKVVAELQESMLGSVKKGDVVEVYYPALDITTQNTITMLGRTIDPANRTFKIEMSTSSLKGQLKPNLLAQVKLNDLTQQDVIMIPISTIQEDVNGNKYVFTVKEVQGEKRARKVLLEVGESNGNEVIILVGLKVGDQLITAGGMNIIENDLIIPTIEANNGK